MEPRTMSNSWTRALCATALLCFFAACDDDPKTSPSPVPEEDASVGEPDAGEDVAECTPGTVGCACDGGGCGDGLTCTNSVCVEVQAGGAGEVQIGASNARACDLLFTQRGSSIKSATYGNGAIGVLRRRNPNVAISLTRDGDTSFPSPALTLDLEGAASGIELVSAKCFDASGASVDTPAVTLGQ